jgi:hypothetical protein
LVTFAPSFTLGEFLSVPWTHISFAGLIRLWIDNCKIKGVSAINKPSLDTLSLFYMTTEETELINCEQLLALHITKDSLLYVENYSYVETVAIYTSDGDSDFLADFSNVQF